MNSLAFIRSISLSLVPFIIGMLLLGHPSLPDEPFGWKQKFGLLFVLFFFIRQVFLFGNVILNLFFKSTLLPSSLQSPASNPQSSASPLFASQLMVFFSLPVGSAFLATLAIALGWMGLIGEKFYWLNLAILFIPFLFKNQLTLKCEIPFFSSNLSDYSAEYFSVIARKILFSALVFGLFLYVLIDFEIKGHGDVFTYHLSSSRIWFDLGRIARKDYFSVIYLSGIWDTFYLWGTELLSSSGGRGLVASQHFAQWLQVIVAYGGSMLALYGLFQAIQLPQSFSLIGVIAAISVHTLNPTYAKNDWGSVFWVISGVALIEWGNLLQEKSRRHAWLIAGLVLGCGVSAKWTTLFFALPWCIARSFVLLSELKNIKKWLITITPIAIGVFLGALPTLLRNWVQVSNPVFPTFNRLFKSPWLIPSTEQYVSQFEGHSLSLAWEKISRNIIELSHDHIYFRLVLISVPLCFLLLFHKKARNISYRYLITLQLSSLLGFILFLAKVGKDTPARLAGPLLIFNASTSILIFLVCCSLFLSKSFFRSRVTQLAIILFMIIASNFPSYALFKVFGFKPSDETLTTFTGGVWKKWVRQNVPADAGIVVTDCEFYYLLTHKILVFPDLIEQNEKIWHYEDPVWTFKMLNPPGYQFIQFVPNAAGLKEFSDWIFKFHSDAIVYQQPDAIIIDSKKIAIPTSL